MTFVGGSRKGSTAPDVIEAKCVHQLNLSDVYLSVRYRASRQHTDHFLLVVDGEPEPREGALQLGGLAQDGLHLLSAAAQRHRGARELHALLHQLQVVFLTSQQQQQLHTKVNEVTVHLYFQRG